MRARSGRLVSWAVGTMMVMLFCGGGQATGGQVSDSSRALIEVVIKAVANLDSPRMGRGRAVVTDARGSDEEVRKYEIAFVFKGDCSRSDRYSIKGGKAKDRDAVWSMGRDVYVSMNPHNAGVHKEVGEQFRGRYGYDFHPGTFTGMWGIPLHELLKRSLASPAEGVLTTQIDGDILTMTHKHATMTSSETNVVKLDASKGFRLVFWSLDLRDEEVDSQNASEKCRIDWKLYDGMWYISAMRLDAGGYKDPDRGHIKPVYVEVRIKEFSDKVTVDEKEFTLDGIGVPEGLYVVDHITGVNYKYGQAEDADDKE